MIAKGIIVVDMPETCGMCKFYRSYAGLTHDCGFYNLPIDPDTKPRLCPIRTIPEGMDKNKISAMEQIQAAMIACKKMMNDYRKNSKERDLLDGMMIAYEMMITFFEKGEIR